MTKIRVLVLGASGMIGRATLALARGCETLELLPASHRDKAGHLKVDYESLTTPAAWEQVLGEHRVDAVVNCVGIWSGTAETFELVQYTVPVALFDACAQLKLRIVQVSALGFSELSPLPYASTKARADRYLLEHCPTGVVVYPSLVFGSEGNSSRFFLNLAALPVQVDLGFPRNLQPVHVDEVAHAVVQALRGSQPTRRIECAGQHRVTVPEYFDAVRRGMGLGAAVVRLKAPQWAAKLLFRAGEVLGAHFVNHQTWVLLQSGTHSAQENSAARPYESFATSADRLMVRETQLYWFARLGIAFLWLCTAWMTWFAWPQAETMKWLDALGAGLGTAFWLAVSCLLDASMGISALCWPGKRLWQAQFAITAVYTAGLAYALPSFWAHPFGPLTKNLPVMAVLLFLALYESKRGR